jgi:hypothetical protein
MNNPVYTSVCRCSQDRLCDIEACDQTATLTTSWSYIAVRPCTPPAALVVKAVVVIPTSTRASLYALLQCGEDSKYRCKSYGGYFEVFRRILAEDGESSRLACGNYQFAAV